MNDRLLIVGGTGFIGRNLVLNAGEHGFNIVVLSLNEPSDKNKIKNVEYLQMDITKPLQIFNIFNLVFIRRLIQGQHNNIKAMFTCI
jgi:nucleoside-diphosphate-sugar epimerase